jgi:hypothetical protein
MICILVRGPRQGVGRTVVNTYSTIPAFLFVQQGIVIHNHLGFKSAVPYGEYMLPRNIIAGLYTPATQNALGKVPVNVWINILDLIMAPLPDVKTDWPDLKVRTEIVQDACLTIWVCHTNGIMASL